MCKFVVPFLAIDSLFLGAASAFANTVTVTIPDPSPNPSIFFGNGDASVTYSGGTFTQHAALGGASLFNVGPLFSGNPAVLSSQEATYGVENIRVTLPWSVDYFSVNYGTFYGSLVTFTASNGATVTQGSTGSGYLTPDSATYSGHQLATDHFARLRTQHQQRYLLHPRTGHACHVGLRHVGSCRRDSPPLCRVRSLLSSFKAEPGGSAFFGALLVK